MPSGAVQRSDFSSSVTLLDVVSFEEAQQRERELLGGASSLAQSIAQVLVWRTEKSIIVPRGMPSRDRYDDAVRAMAERGFPVYERDTGGDLTPQSPGMINLSMVFRLDGASPNIKDAYLRLVQPVIEFLRHRYDLAADVCAVPGAFCDGAYNIAYQGKKLAGTAQRWRLIGGEGPSRQAAVLGHVALMVDVDLVPAIDALNEFYAVAGIDRHIELEKHITLAQLARGDASGPADVALELSRFIAQSAGVGPKLAGA
jgi:hypothetical protein